MFRYIARRIALLVPTLLGVMIINFSLIHLAPGGPIDQIKMQLKAEPSDYLPTQYRPIVMDQEMIAFLEKEFEYDKPLYQRFFKMLLGYLTFDFGESFFKGCKVSDLLWEAFPVSLFLACCSMMIILMISIPLGVIKAVYQGSIFDWFVTMLISISFSIPSFVFAIVLLLTLTKNNLFPLRGIMSENFEQMNWWGQVKDMLWHMTLPILATVLGNFARPTLLTYNALVQEMSKLYVLTVKAKGASDRYVLFNHCMKNAILVVYANIPHAFLAILFYTSLLVEVIFSLHGVGHLSYEATITRDYPVMFALLYLFSLMAIVLHIVGDIVYSFLDPRLKIEEQKH